MGDKEKRVVQDDDITIGKLGIPILSDIDTNTKAILALQLVIIAKLSDIGWSSLVMLVLASIMLLIIILDSYAEYLKEKDRRKKDD